MEIDHTFNFNDPVEVLMIFRTPNPTGGAPIEHSGEALFSWGDIKMIEAYMYTDDWNQHKGEKYFITLFNDPQSKLVLGSYKSMKTYWTMFLNKFGQYGNQEANTNEPEE